MALERESTGAQSRERDTPLPGIGRAVRGLRERRASLRTAVPEMLGWWVAGIALWLATAASVSGAELALAASSSLVCAVLAWTVRRRMGFRARPRTAWLLWALLVPVCVVRDILRLTRHAILPAERGMSGQLRELTLPGGGLPSSVGWRAGAMVAVSATPGTVFLHTDPRTGRALVHTLVSGPPSLEERVIR